MAGHSQFKNIMHRKGRQDAVRAKQFNKIAREITVAAKSGLPDPAANPRLRAAMQAARAVNMPRDRIDRAIKSAQPGAADSANYEEMRYEGYGPGGVAIIVEALTDNRQRTAPDMRMIFSKNGGTLGDTNSVSFMFNRYGLIQYPAATATIDAMLEAVIEAGGNDVESNDETHNITTETDELGAVRTILEEKFGTPQAARLTWVPQTLIPVGGEAAESLIKMLDALEEHDDVQNVIGNYDIDESVLQKMAS
ncbi:MAG: YebC/PmpR family DNA-binding transcriptional regulator [Alphaproteobacteria bacterium]|nr:YebC/PmpR family DNA-binding transcriptional regulator [Alphaproteobacteria bacterium]